MPIEFLIVNTGPAKAHIKTIGSNVWQGDHPWTDGTRKISFDIVESSDTLSAGEERIATTAQRFIWSESASNWWCAGFIEYEDGGEVGHHRAGYGNGFLRRSC